TVLGQNAAYERKIEYKKIKNNKITDCGVGEKIKLVTIYTDSVFKAKITHIDREYIVLEIKQYRLTEIKSIEKETVIYKTFRTSAGLCLLIGSTSFIGGHGDFDAYVFGAASFATGILLAIPTIALRRKYILNVTHYASIQ
ncbi:MAG: hypothetical protein H7259_01055, partial [Cytophagales bacterium]|nr:hypothetical protein [Cytophaga sp.]